MYSTVKSFLCREISAEVDVHMPTVRDPDSYMYVREWSGGILAGYCEVSGGRPCFQDGIPDSLEFQLLPGESKYIRKLKLKVCLLVLIRARINTEFLISINWLHM